MHVFLAGSTGALGRRVLPLLLNGGHQVTAALIRDPRQAPQLAALGAGTTVADARDRGAVAAAVAAARPDVVMQQLTDLASAPAPPTRRCGPAPRAAWWTPRLPRASSG